MKMTPCFATNDERVVFAFRKNRNMAIAHKFLNEIKTCINCAEYYTPDRLYVSSCAQNTISLLVLPFHSPPNS